MATQNDLRADLCQAMLDAVTAPQGVTLSEAAVAGMGAVAIVLGAMAPAERAIVAQRITDNLLQHADKRAAEIRSGAIDRAMARHTAERLRKMI